MATSRMAYASSRIGIDIDGIGAFLKSVKGGYTKAEVANTVRVDQHSAKHLATLTPNPATIEFGVSSSLKAIYDWMQATLDLGHVYKDGAIMRANMDYEVESRLDFFEALIKSITFPTMDASNKDACHLSLEFLPVRWRRVPGDGSKLTIGGDVATKKWLCSNFRFELGDLPCTKVSKIEGLKWEQEVIAAPTGLTRESEQIAANIKVPNIKITLLATDADPWWAWYDSFVIQGKCADPDELTGRLTFLGPDLEEELGGIDFFNVGIFSCTEADSESNKAALAQITVECYCERMAFQMA